MPNYTPPDSLQANLNFKDELQSIDAHNLVLNFGLDEIQEASLIAEIYTAFNSEIFAESFTLNLLDAELQTGFNAEIVVLQGQFSQLACEVSSSFIAIIEATTIDQFCTIEADLNTSFVPNLDAQFDINFNLGIFAELSASYQLTKQILRNNGLKFSKPILKALNSAFFYDHGLSITHESKIKHDQASSLRHSIKLIFEESTGLKSDSCIAWQDNQRIKITKSLVFEESNKLNIQRSIDWVELVRKRKQFTYSFDVAQHFEMQFQIDWDKGLELVTTCDFAWDKAKPVHYIKHSITPWPEPEKPQFEGDTDFNFICACTEIDAHNLILNFGVDDCIPSIVNKNWWYIVNEVSIVNTRTNEVIKVLNGSYSTDRSRWCWSYSLTVIEPEMLKLEKGDVLKIIVNGNIHMMMYEEYSKSQKFADTTYNLTGRSQTALLESKYSPVRSYLQENERTSVQLAQAELDRVSSETALDWQLIDELGWIVETESLSYTNLAPIDAIKLIAEAGGGFVYSEKSSNTVSIRPLYKKTFWDALNLDDYDRNLPESIVIQHGDSFDALLDFNAITLTNPRNGNVGQIRRRNTAGDILLDPVSNPLFNAVSMGGFGKSKLAKSGNVESHDFDFPITHEIGECVPGEILAFNCEWWGTVDAVSVSFNYAVVSQSIKVERTVNE
ncbi:hypothetical protein [Acinetobacter sp.]|uniref:hypothetical protein n=1 Tax=Acinetobacter sp. TaxID=472 RepID=UPI00248997A5|nr:hypothetical protein [Acinetobacter sp.]MDI1225213.1 hypothetical protein [Acinetobacter sp.]